MSFSGDVKQEISRQISEARHCMIAEIAALIQMAGKIKTDDDGKIIINFFHLFYILYHFYTTHFKYISHNIVDL